jgi:flavorubredoxin
MKKATTLDIATICPLHGPELEGEALAEAIRLYSTWSNNEVETKGVLVAHASIHGNTARVAEKLGEMLEARGAGKVAVADLCREDMAEVIEDAFRMRKVILCGATYDGDVFPPMHQFLWKLQLKAFQNATVGLVENGTWAPMAAKAMRALIEPMKNVTIVEPVVSIKSALKDEDLPQLEALVNAMI